MAALPPWKRHQAADPCPGCKYMGWRGLVKRCRHPERPCWPFAARLNLKAATCKYRIDWPGIGEGPAPIRLWEGKT